MFCFILFVFLTSTFVSDTEAYGYQYFQNVQGWLKFHRIPVTWKEARLQCELEGSTLASPVSTDMIEAMTAMMHDNGSQPCGIFTGIHQTYTKGRFYTIKGTPLSQVAAKLVTNKTQCRLSVDECLLLLPDGTLIDTVCADHYPFICHKTKLEEMSKNLSCTTDPAYILDERTGSCYKFHKYGVFFDEAAKICSTEGGHLAIINSDDEAQALKDFFAKQPTNSFGKLLNYVAFIGFLEWDSRWLTIFGQPIADAGYSRWGRNQPDNAGGHQDCGGFFRSGELDDLTCNTTDVAFICEITPEFNKNRY